jgi:hypothetical protein
MIEVPSTLKSPRRSVGDRRDADRHRRMNSRAIPDFDRFHFDAECINSIRRECLDHVIIFNESHLRRAFPSYLRYYHKSRTVCAGCAHEASSLMLSTRRALPCHESIVARRLIASTPNILNGSLWFLKT